MKKWIRRQYDRWTADLARRIAGHLLGVMDQSAKPPIPEGDIRLVAWYPTCAQAVLAQSVTRKSGADKRDAVVDTMRQWFATRNLVCPPTRVLHLAIETALAFPLKKG